MPTGTGNVVINHAVVLDVNYDQINGTITISPTGSLVRDLSIRTFALNAPAGTASMNVQGTFQVGRVALMSGTVDVSGQFIADSLLNQANLTVGGVLQAGECWNAANGVLTNNGYLSANDFLNTGTAENTVDMTAYNFCNSKSFNNAVGANIEVMHDFSNIDTLASPAVFVEDGFVIALNDWHNGNQISGSGQFCVASNSWNSGSMTGVLDFCDYDHNTPDLNTGTIASSVTFCTRLCFEGIQEVHHQSDIEISPNPVNENTRVRTAFNLTHAQISITDVTGRVVLQVDSNNSNEFPLGTYLPSLHKGMYLLSIDGPAGHHVRKFVVR